MSRTVRKSTPILFVERIEASLPFFEAVGFVKVMDVPDGDRFGFCILDCAGVEVMLQSCASLAADMRRAAARGRGFLFMEVPDLAAVEAALAGHAVYMPRRSTFYGSEETGFIDPGGHYVTFAQFAQGH
ncbi:MAG: hypothetical protein IPG63_19770 [Xanthomonadales bacterium]|nr:hypothetical protein [Xanthomonadales bacterium]